MKILIYGAGVIGSLYGVYLSKAKCDVSLLARGKRLTELCNKGLLYYENKSVQRANVSIMNKISADDYFDYIIVTVRANQLHEVLKDLRNNISPTIVTMVNSLEDYSIWENLCGKGRILPAFPGAGGSIENGILNAGMTPRIVQSTTLSEIDGKASKRLCIFKNLLQKAGIHCQIITDMHMWQVCHLAMVVPIADAYYMVDKAKFAYKNKQVMRKTAESLHNNFKKLKSAGIEITPAKLNFFCHCPIFILSQILPWVYRSQFGEQFMYQHAVKAQGEMAKLHKDFYTYIEDDTRINSRQ